MALGTSLAADLQSSFEAHNTAQGAADAIAASINTYLSGAVYASGSILYSSSCVGSDFLLATNGSISIAADKWSTGLDNYFNGAATAGVPQNAGYVISLQTLVHAGVKASLQASLTTIFNIGTGNPTTSSQATAIANAIDTAVKTITTTHTETQPVVPFAVIPLTSPPLIAIA